MRLRWVNETQVPDIMAIKEGETHRRRQVERRLRTTQQLIKVKI